MRIYTKKNSKNSRTRMSPGQVEILVDSFKENPFPSTSTREELSKTLGTSPRTVQIWFQNQRQKVRNQTRAPEKRDVFKEYVHYEHLRKLCILAYAATCRMEDKYEF
ncbi:homeobox protein HD-3 [Encephalitozoon intestinalis]